MKNILLLFTLFLIKNKSFFVSIHTFLLLFYSLLFIIFYRFTVVFTFFSIIHYIIRLPTNRLHRCTLFFVSMLTHLLIVFFCRFLYLSRCSITSSSLLCLYSIDCKLLYLIIPYPLPFAQNQIFIVSTLHQLLTIHYSHWFSFCHSLHYSKLLFKPKISQNLPIFYLIQTTIKLLQQSISTIAH